MDLRFANVILTQEPAQGPRGCEGSREAARPQVLLSTHLPFPLKKCHIYPSHTLTSSSDSICRNESTALNMFEDNCHSAVTSVAEVCISYTSDCGTAAAQV